MDDFSGENKEFNYTTGGFPPKPVMVEQRTNAVARSLISLMIYAVLFYFMFERNLAYIAAILVVIIIHETGHFLFMKLFNYSNVKIFIVPLLGAFTSGKKQNVSQLQLSIIILAGPLPGIIIGSVMYYLNQGLNSPTITMLANSFLIINVLNCLPFYPLDGGRLIETLFFKQNHIIRLVFGIISIIALAYFFLASPVMLVVPVLIGLELFNENKHQKIREYLSNEKIDYHTEYKILPDKDYWLIRDCILFSFPKKYPGIAPGHYQYSVAEPLLVQHINSILQPKVNYDMSIFARIFTVIIYVAAIAGPLIFIKFGF